VQELESIDIKTLQNMLSIRLSEMVDNGEKNKAIAIAQQFEKQVFSKLRSESDRPKLSKVFGVTAYGIQIEQECKPIESIRQAAEHLDQDFTKIKDLKMQHDKWYYNNYALSVYQQWFTSEDNQMLPKSDLRKDVRSSETLNSGLNKVYKYQKLDKEIRKLKQRADNTEAELFSVKAQQLLQSMDIEHIKEVSGWTMEPPDKAKALKAKGYTYDKISQTMGISKSTARRWVNNS